jgi:putrescine transport system substrate-binding protein
MMDAQIAADNTNYVYYASGNGAALDLIDPEVKEDPSIYPTPDISANLFTLNAHSPDYSELLTRSWTRVKSGQ